MKAKRERWGVFYSTDHFGIGINLNRSGVYPGEYGLAAAVRISLTDAMHAEGNPNAYQPVLLPDEAE